MTTLASEKITRTWEPVTRRLRTSNGTGKGLDALWEVEVRPADKGMIKRRIRTDDVLWVPDDREWCPDLTIWPSWSPAMSEKAATDTPLEGVHDYWRDADERLRDSAKWMATVIGAGLAALVGTSPLAAMRGQLHEVGAWVAGLSGLALLMATLLLTMWVMRPQSVSYNDVQLAAEQPGRWRANPLRAWKEIAESQQDLYLPCGVKCLTSLRQSMIVEEVTLMALAHALAQATDPEEMKKIVATQAARAARLKELRDACARIATIGEFYRVRANSGLATNAGAVTGLFGIILIVLFFAM